jgi:hypothetical protein
MLWISVALFDSFLQLYPGSATPLPCSKLEQRRVLATRNDGRPRLAEPCFAG